MTSRFAGLCRLLELRFDILEVLPFSATAGSFGAKELMELDS